MLVNWQELTVEKSSMLGITNGKFVKMNDRHWVPFMLCYGYVPNGIKLYLIEGIRNDYKVYLCNSIKEADETAFKIIVYASRGGCILDFIKEKGEVS